MILSSHGANISAVDKNGQIPLHLAVKYGNFEFFEWLLPLMADNGVSVDFLDNELRSPLHLACIGGKRYKMMVSIEKSEFN